MYLIQRTTFLIFTLPILAFSQAKVDTVSFDQVAISIGDMAPNFFGEDETGRIINLSDLEGEKISFSSSSVDIGDRTAVDSWPNYQK